MGGKKTDKTSLIDISEFRLSLELGTSLPTGAAKQAVEVLGRRIVNDTYLPGDVMPTEPELAESMSVSRATIRDAIKVLSGKGMVRTARRYGTKVRPVEEWNLLDADVIAWHDPTHDRVGQMFVETTELRCIIEPAAAELAATRATPAQVKVINDAASALHPAAEDDSETFAADCLFHATILDATGNLIMRQLRPIIISILRISYDFGVQQIDGNPVTREGHLRVADAISDGDGQRAREEMDAMLSVNRRTADRYWRTKKPKRGPTG